MNKKVEVIIPLNVYSTYSYLYDNEIIKGDLVEINFHNKILIGLVLDVKSYEHRDELKLKYINKKLNILLKEEFVDFVKWCSNYTLIPIGLVFKLIFSERYLESNKKELNYYKFLSLNNKKITKTQENVVNFLKENFDNKYCFNDLKNFCTLGILKTLVKNGIIFEEKNKISKNYNIVLQNILLNTLTEEQQKIFENIIELENQKPVLLEGITGSGKTEIYFHLFKHYLNKSIENQILFLLPEIALTSQFIDRFKKQFNCDNIAVWHSNINDNDKKEIWHKIYTGEIKIVIGARSALFLPFKKLSLIVVDEEHDNSYKQTDNGCYNARDMAIVRAKFENCKILLGSATPSIESLINVENEKYNYFYLKSRYGKSILPLIEVVDLKKEKLKYNNYLSKYLIEEMKKELDKGNQVLLYMNRRGYAPIAICKECGHRFLCKNCSCNVAVHENKKKFICHQCGYSINQVNNCPECGIENSIIFFGPGVEKIDKEVKEVFKDKETLIITSDTINNSREINEAVDKIQNNKVNIIIGTQMITKGYDFDKLTLVGILDADASLFGANFRATEKTYQLLTQVVGRVGRRETVGKAIIQTYNPESLIIQSLIENDKNKLLNFEKDNRKIDNLPPYGKLIMLIFYGRNEIETYQKTKEFIKIFPYTENIEVLGPTPTNLYKSNNFFRFKVLLKSKNNINLQKTIINVLNLIELKNIKLKIDVNPYFII